MLAGFEAGFTRFIGFTGLIKFLAFTRLIGITRKDGGGQGHLGRLHRVYCVGSLYTAYCIGSF